MIDCHKCKYYYVTWEKQFPHGCRAMNFKSLQFPSALVKSSSGIACMRYRPKQEGKGGDTPKRTTKDKP